MTLLLNAVRAVSVHRHESWSGAWSADVELDLGDLPDLPTGPAILTIDKATLVCAIDPERSGRFGPTARARVVGGSGGWEKYIQGRHFKNDAGVLSTNVLSATAAEVLERVVDVVPELFPSDYVRTDDEPASQVLKGRTWYIAPTGTTIVGPRPRVPATPDVEILSWDPQTRAATIKSDSILTPGTILVDLRFGSAVVRDVEQTWNGGGATATAWTMDPDADDPAAPGGELVGLMRAFAREAVGASLLGRTRYRVAAQGPDGRLNLVAFDPTTPVKALKAVAISPAIPGLEVKVVPGTIVHVAFLEGKRSLPRVVDFESSPAPLEVTFKTARFAVGLGTKPIASATELLLWATNVNAALNTLGAPIAPLAPTVASTKGFTE